MKKIKEKSRCIEQYEIDAVHKKFSEKDDGENLAIFRIFLQTGMRVSEFAEYYTRADIITKNAVGITPLKQKEDIAKRRIKFLPEIEYLKKNNFSGYGAKALKKRFERGKLNFSPHDLRATCITRLLDQGISPGLVQKHIGHKKIDTTLKYARFNDSGHNEGLYDAVLIKPGVVDTIVDAKKRILVLEEENMKLKNLLRMKGEDV